jgi:hypothetical protein
LPFKLAIVVCSAILETSVHHDSSNGNQFGLVHGVSEYTIFQARWVVKVKTTRSKVRVSVAHDLNAQVAGDVEVHKLVEVCEKAGHLMQAEVDAQAIMSVPW